MPSYFGIFDYETFKSLPNGVITYYGCRFSTDIRNESTGAYFCKGQWVLEIDIFPEEIFAEVYDFDMHYWGKFNISTNVEKKYENLPFEKPK